MFDELEHDFFIFADAEASQCDAVKVEAGDVVRAFFSEIFVNCALGDTKKELLRVSMRFHAALRPEVCSADRFLHCSIVLIRWRNVIEGHGDVASECFFDFHDFFWCEAFVFSGIGVVKGDAVVVNGSEELFAEDLESAAVREDAAVPVDEFVQSAAFFY